MLKQNTSIRVHGIDWVDWSVLSTLQLKRQITMIDLIFLMKHCWMWTNFVHYYHHGCCIFLFYKAYLISDFFCIEFRRVHYRYGSHIKSNINLVKWSNKNILNQLKASPREASVHQNYKYSSLHPWKIERKNPQSKD